MKFKELIEKVPTPEQINQNRADFDTFREELCPELYNYPKQWSDFKVYSQGYGQWLCTDSWVGWVAYFYNNSLVAISYQSGRKSPKEFSWVSIEEAYKVKEHIESIVEKDELTVDIIDKECYEEEVGLGFHVGYPSELLTNNLIEKETGKPCKVIENYFKYAYGPEEKNAPKELTRDQIWHGVKVKFKKGEEKILDLRSELLVPWSLNTDY